MHIAFLNPHGNFDPHDSHWTAHPDFGGQLVYVKQVALAMAEAGHTVDILTRQIIDADWPEFSSPEAVYDDAPGVRILRLPAGPNAFLRKELIWSHLVDHWIPRVLAHYEAERRLPDAFTGHYADGGLAGAVIEERTGIPFTFTAHSLGAQKMDQLEVTEANLAEMDAHYHFARRLFAERLSMNRSAVTITSTRQERFEQYGHQAYDGAVDVEDGRRFQLIPPGVNLAIFGADVVNAHEAETQGHVAAMLARDIDADRQHLPAVIASSRLDPKKNPLDLVRAFAQTPELRSRANLILVSGAHSDPLRDDTATNPTERAVLAEIREVVGSAGLWGKIAVFELIGQPTLAAAYRCLAQRGSIFALTALYEPFGLAPLEAAAAGLPLVVTKNGGPSESLRDGVTEYGILVDPTDPDDIAQGLLRLLRDPGTWANFARLGQQRVLDRYTWERTAEGYLAVIEAMIADPHARRPDTLLPLHPYFVSASGSNDITLDELREVYYPKTG